VITTVSESYAREILTPEYGEGLETLLQSRKDRLFGIVNGLDYEQFDPGTDRVLAVNYDVNAVEKRAENKIALQRQAGLPVNPDVPLIGMAGRLVEQKGIDITEQALNSLLGESDVQFVLQGAGSPVYQELMQDFENRHQDKARMFLEYDLALAHRIFAGCDIFLVPSRFEPCGLTPLIAMRYGAIPVVRRTGGLGETINDYVSNEQNGGIGFIFDKYDAGELLAAVKRALNVLADKQEWHRLVVRAMNADYSWNASLLKYLALYESARSMTIHP
ncbi:MAG: glycogen synthase, partial [Dehalococcoidia bacterium]|nr:glycogen synthase [Dehalococcoidia bacterium]